MIYDGYDFSALMKVETPVGRSLLAEVQVETEAMGRDGEIYKSASLTSLKLDVPVRIITPAHDVDGQRVAFEDVRRLIAGKLWRKTPCELVLDDAPDLTYMAVLQGSTDLERFVYTGGTTLSFLSPKPYGLGREKVERSADGTAWCTVSGNTSTFPVVEVESQTSDFTIYFDRVPFVLGGTLSGADPVIIDATEDARSCTKGGAAVRVAITSDYPEWEPGRHQVSCDHPFTVAWRERWL